jgi:hypothetical protein
MCLGHRLLLVAKQKAHWKRASGLSLSVVAYISFDHRTAAPIRRVISASQCWMKPLRRKYFTGTSMLYILHQETPYPCSNIGYASLKAI